jgi:hypothetical protein
MNKILTAIALSIALPAAAYAQGAPTPAAEKDCCEKMKAEGKECCCKDMAKKGHGEHGAKDGADAHAGHDKSGADTHQNHQQ